MSLKRKGQPENTKDEATKKAKLDFFAPRKAQSSTVAQKTTPLFTFKPKNDASVRLVTWNVNGITSVDAKILKNYLDAEDPTILILTETKSSKGRPDIMCLKTRFKYQYWGVDPKPGYAGTAVLSKIKPIKTETGLPGWQESSGRYIELEYPAVFIIGSYAPFAGDNFKNMDLKKRWNEAIKTRFRTLRKSKPIIWAGDFNCIMNEKDLDKTGRGFWDQMSGLSKEEREGMLEIIQTSKEEEEDFESMVDAWRQLHPEDEEFTHSSGKFGSWRLDSFILSKSLVGDVKDSEIRHELRELNLSDHWPVTLDISLDLESKQ